MHPTRFCLHQMKKHKEVCFKVRVPFHTYIITYTKYCLKQVDST